MGIEMGFFSLCIIVGLILAVAFYCYDEDD